MSFVLNLFENPASAGFSFWGGALLARASPDIEFMSYQDYHLDGHLLCNERIAPRLYADEIPGCQT